MLATIIMALAMLVTGTVTSLAQPEPSFRATCSELRAAVARLELAGDPLVTIQVEGRLTTVKSESGLVYLILCEQPDPRVLCVTYQENGRKPGDIVVVSGAFAQVDPDHIQLDPCLQFSAP